MPSKVVSIRLTAQNLTDCYNFLSIACGKDINNLPVSTSVQKTLEALMNWLRKEYNLPLYNTDAEAQEALMKLINKVPTVFLAPPTPADLSTLAISEELHNATEHLIVPNQNDNSMTPEEKAEAKEQEEKKKAALVGMFENYVDKQEKQEEENLLSAIKSSDLYTNEDDEDYICPHCNRRNCICSEFDVSPDMGDQ